jgi:uncharacterized Zn ribbon protein
MKDIKEDKDKEVRKVCEKCNSAYVYTLVNGQIICRRCGHRSPAVKD